MLSADDQWARVQERAAKKASAGNSAGLALAQALESALAAVKQWGILRQPLRARQSTTADMAMLIRCGLHNDRIDLRPEGKNTIS